jgi:hypothetical protein
LVEGEVARVTSGDQSEEGVAEVDLSYVSQQVCPFCGCLGQQES